MVACALTFEDAKMDRAAKAKIAHAVDLRRKVRIVIPPKR
jgi:hypothetical protein